MSDYIVRATAADSQIDDPDPVRRSGKRTYRDSGFPWPCQGISYGIPGGTAVKCTGQIRCGRSAWTWRDECHQGYGLKRTVCGTDRTADRRDR